MKAKTNRLLSLLLALMMLLGVNTFAPQTATAAGTAASPIVINVGTVNTNGSGYTYTSGTVGIITITENGYYTFTGSTTSKRVVISSGMDVNVTFNGLSINRSGGSTETDVNCPFLLSAYASVNLTIEGTNILKGGYYRAALQVPKKTTIIIGGDGILEAEGGRSSAGIGDGYTSVTYGTDYHTWGNITINSGTIKAVGGYDGAGIGGGGNNRDLSGSITINGGIITAIGGDSSAGIGGGYGGSGGNITITAGDITSTAGSGSAGIGGSIWGSGGSIAISGGTIRATGGDHFGVGIGSGEYGDGDDITISGGSVEAFGKYGGAGIGGGSAGHAGGNITISGGTVKAVGGDGGTDSNYASPGAGIGSSGGTNLNGPGHSGYSGDIAILGNAAVTAIGGNSTICGGGAGIGSGGAGGTNAVAGQVGMITIEGTIITSGTPSPGQVMASGGTGMGTPPNTMNGANIGTGGSPSKRGTEVSPINRSSGSTILLSDSSTLSGTGWTYSTATNIFTITGSVTIAGTTTTNRVKVNSGVNANIKLFRTTLDASATGCAFDMTGATVTLTLEGVNTVKSGLGYAGLQVLSGATLTINGDGSLNAYGGGAGTNTGGGAGIGGNGTGTAGTITITGGTISASGGTGNASAGGGAGIGGGGGYNNINSGSSGNIIITGSADVTVAGGVSTSGAGADIGSGGKGSGTSTAGVSGTTFVALPEGKLKCASSVPNPVVFSAAPSSSNGTVKATLPAPFSTTVDLFTGVGSGSTAKTLSVVTSFKTESITFTLSGYNYVPVTKTGNALMAAGAAVDFKDPSSSGSTIIVSDTTTTSGPGWSYSDGVFTITGNVTISGTTTANRVVVASGMTANVTLKDVTIDLRNSTGSGTATCAFTGGSGVNLTLEGDNTLRSGTDAPGISSSGLTISGTGSLLAYGGSGGAGIGGGTRNSNYSVTINGGDITAYGGNYGAGIGGGKNSGGGAIIINGGTVKATGNSGALGYTYSGGAGIGGGGQNDNYYNGHGGNITITGGNVTANGSYCAAGIGGAASGNGGNITITGGTVNATGSSTNGPGIGGGYNGSAGFVKISGGNVTAKAGSNSPGIGNGYGGRGGTVWISGGIVNATGGRGGAGIGSAINTSSGGGKIDNIIISGGTITANGGTGDSSTSGGAGIGGGGASASTPYNSANIIITENAAVTTTGGNASSHAGGAGIGSGGAINLGGPGKLDTIIIGCTVITSGTPVAGQIKATGGTGAGTAPNKRDGAKIGYGGGYTGLGEEYAYSSPSAVTMGVSPANATVQKGGAAQAFTATVTGISDPSKLVTWSISGNNSSKTTISTEGVLTVDADETATTLTVRATSMVFTGKSGTANITLSNPTPVVSEVKVSPTSITVSKNSTQSFSAAVSGKYNPVQTVTWSISGNDSPGTTISTTGVLFVAMNETAATLTVKATSTFDTSKFGTATVTVTSMPVVNVATPSITAQPTSFTTVNVGVTANLTIVATKSDTGTLTYQWYSNNVNSSSGGTLISGATGTSYSVPTTTAGTMYYYCVVTNTNNSVNGNKTATATSNIATVTVNAIIDAVTPNITTQPTGTTVNVGGTANLSIAATRSDTGTLTYQWYSNITNNNSGGTLISGATGASYSVPTITAGIKYYYCVVINTNSSVNGSKTATATSNVATVTVNTLVTNAVTVIGGTGGDNYTAGSTVTITVGTVPAGKQFREWTATSGTGVTFANKNDKTTTFTMPAGAVTITAIFEDTPADVLTFNFENGGQVKIFLPAGIVATQNAEFKVDRVMPPPDEVVDIIMEHYNNGVIIVDNYEIRLRRKSDNSLIFDLDKEITIAFKLPDGYSNNTGLRIAAIDADGKVVELDSWIEDGFIHFRTDWLETYDW